METVMRSYPNDWVAGSIMHRKGVGGGASGVTRQLTEETQGTYLYTIGPMPTRCSPSRRATG